MTWASQEVATNSQGVAKMETPKWDYPAAGLMGHMELVACPVGVLVIMGRGKGQMSVSVVIMKL